MIPRPVTDSQSVKAAAGSLVRVSRWVRTERTSPSRFATSASAESRLISSSIGVPIGAAGIVKTATVSNFENRQTASNRLRSVSGSTGPKSRSRAEGVRLGPLRSRWSTVSGSAATSEGPRWGPPSTIARSNLLNSSSAI